jgi:hypothetical protein
MRAYIRRRFGRHWRAALSLLLMLAASAPVIRACSWDYPIWMIRSKDADPLYRFVRDGKAGYIDRTGKVVIEPRFEVYGNSGDEFHSGLLQTGVADGPYADKTGKIVLDKGYYRNWEFSEGLAVAMREDGGKWGYIDTTGEFVIGPRFDGYPHGYPYPFSDGLAMIEVGKRYGYIDRTGEFVIRPRFLKGSAFSDGMARVIVEGPCVYFDMGPCAEARRVGDDLGGTVAECKFSFIDRSGRVVTGGYQQAKDFSEGLAAVAVGEKWGYIDKKGQVIIEPKFDEAEPFSDGLAKVKMGELFGYVDRGGAFLIPPQFEYADDFSEGLAVVGRWDEERAEFEDFYYIDKRGRQAIEGKFALASHFFKGLAHVKLKSKNRTDDDDSRLTGTFAYINTSGRKIFIYKREAEE